ncbi:heavy metal translocating P-type ATPase [Intestinibacter bartlettii]|uniref:Cd(2+)-exporting ATPase n=1 Tax=Intestinibacter bartlettii TaxID=261299 RepID=A0ABS6DTG5_9FIRM|nr:heavy metal translocating P-type ATPase [Intestinibacter bartlettii]MBU5335128.1 cadmium-translocating P-type ATPase [Intestinibacter bartlettii]MDO5010413.1 heavy metal translocating P-type ATPase [Intestinibacter bartlettii]
MSSKKKTLILENLDCASCANKIESEVKNIDGINNASVNFVSSKLDIYIDDKIDENDIVNIIKNKIKIIEPGINIVDTDKRKESTSEHGEEKESKYEILLLVAGAILFFVAMFFNISSQLKLVLYLASYFLLGWDILLNALKNIFRGKIFDENFLMAIATIGAFIIGEYAEGVAVMLFFKIGESFQSYAVNKSRKSISALMDIRPDYANLKVGNETKKVSPEEVNIDDIIIVKAGEKIPLDGVVVEGKSMIDTSALTGESLPVKVESGSNVLSGSINNNGILEIKVSKEFNESTVSKILDLVENASSSKAETENFITRFAKYYTPVVVIVALGLAIIPPLILRNNSWYDWIYRALVFLVVSCPCGLVISVPLGFFSGIGTASKNGILIKGSNYLEYLSKAEIFVFDKTGTLTKGVFKVTKINNQKDISEEELLEYAAYAEYYSNHPIGVSIVKAYNKDINKNEIKDYNEISGHGISVNVKGKKVLAGNSKLMNKENIKYEEVKEIGTIVHIAVDSKYYGYLIISDEIKDDAKKAIEGLRKLKIKNIVMLTGDSKVVAENVAKELNLNSVEAELLPDQKVEKVKELYKTKSPKGTLVFTGDGINDAPVLAIADVGVAMGGLGSDAAIEAADMVIMNDEPSKLIDSIKISRRTEKIVWQNIIIALGVKIIVLILGALGFANMWEAVFADVGVTLIAVINSIRIMKYS